MAKARSGQKRAADRRDVCIVVVFAEFFRALQEQSAVMVFDNIEKLKRQWTDKYVIADTARPELARFKGMSGRVKTINMNGRALVQFDEDANIGWYDISLDYLKVVDAPLPKPSETKERVARAEAKAPPAPPAKPQTPAKKPSTADILAAARAKKGEASLGESSAKPAAKKLSTADILAAARGKITSGTTADASPPSASAVAAPQPSAEQSAPAPKPSTAEILAAARGKQVAAPVAAAPTAAEEAPTAVAADSGPAAAVVEENGEAAAKTSRVDRGALPKTTAEKIAYCRRVDSKG
jgi:hypothetical protein